MNKKTRWWVVTAPQQMVRGLEEGGKSKRLTAEEKQKKRDTKKKKAIWGFEATRGDDDLVKVGKEQAEQYSRKPPFRKMHGAGDL